MQSLSIMTANGDLSSGGVVLVGLYKFNYGLVTEDEAIVTGFG